jgi:hypothetical protein
MTVFRGHVSYPTSRYHRCECGKWTSAYTRRCGSCKAWHNFWSRLQARERRKRLRAA